MKNYITRHQPNKGYIPNDKATVSCHRFEKFSFSHIPELAKKWAIIENDYKKDVYTNKPARYDYELQRVVLEFLSYASISGHPISPVEKSFYFNFNHDGIDVFINRSL